MPREAGSALHLREISIQIREGLIKHKEGLILIIVVVAIAVAEEEVVLPPANPLSQWCNRHLFRHLLLSPKLLRSCTKLSSGWLSAANAGLQPKGLKINKKNSRLKKILDLSSQSYQKLRSN